MAHTVIQQQGYGKDALSTLFFLFGLSSIGVGTVFYSLGRFQLGRVVYFFPRHVLIGCIGGIGVFVMVTGISVTNNVDFTLDQEGLQSLLDNVHLIGVVIVLESLLRFLIWITKDKDGKPRFTLLAPCFFLGIVPMFYSGLYVLGVDVKTATEMGYFFPNEAEQCDPLTGECVELSFLASVFNGHILDMFRVIDLRMVSWTAVSNSLGTVLAMIAFSLIHVPLNIPAFSVSADVDADMDLELRSHGYANVLSGVFGGLQTIMTYSFSVLYMKTGGKGKLSSLGVVGMCILMFVFGPAGAAYCPRCMAGTVLLHIGLDLFLEGVYDSYGNFDYLEYSGVSMLRCARPP